MLRELTAGINRVAVVTIAALVVAYTYTHMKRENWHGSGVQIFQDLTTATPRSAGHRCNSGQRNFSQHSLFSKSQQGEDAFLWNFFGDLCEGSYIELGALDGVTYSNSHVFSKALNWSGILIEASPSNAAKLARNRPNDICVNAAVCQTTGVVHYLEGGAVGGVWEFMADGFRNRWHEGKSILDSTEVPCAPLSEIVRQHTKREFFDFLSLDVEGGEYSVIQTINSLEFGMILVEADGHDARKNSMVQTFLLRKGYVQILASLGNNQVYIHPHFHDIYSILLE